MNKIAIYKGLFCVSSMTRGRLLNALYRDLNLNTQANSTIQRDNNWGVIIYDGMVYYGGTPILNGRTLIMTTEKRMFSFATVASFIQKYDSEFRHHDVNLMAKNGINQSSLDSWRIYL